VRPLALAESLRDWLVKKVFFTMGKSWVRRPKRSLESHRNSPLSPVTANQENMRGKGFKTKKKSGKKIELDASLTALRAAHALREEEKEKKAGAVISNAGQCLSLILAPAMIGIWIGWRKGVIRRNNWKKILRKKKSKKENSTSESFTQLRRPHG